jgi:hypothetical protein
MGVARKTEFSAAKLGPQEHKYRGCDDQNRNRLLPIHVGNITSKALAATGHLQIMRVTFCTLRCKKRLGVSAVDLL